MAFLTLLMVPMLVAFCFFILGKRRVTLQEFLIHIGVQCVVAGVSIGIMYWSNTSDTEVWNGKITGKKRERVHCQHSYRCFCYESCSGSGSSRSCHQVCQTCYEHSYDVSWYVFTNIGDSFTISRVNRQGTIEPPRWSAIQPGEPYATTKSYTNYIKASPDTLFRQQGLVEKYKKFMPSYPQRVYDYYRLNRIVLVNGAKLENINTWNEELSELNAEVGPVRQANVILTVVKDLPADYFHALRQFWIGGKKNDIVPVIGVDANNAIQWVEIMSWSQDKIFDIKLRDDLLNNKTLDMTNTLSIIKDDTMKYFKRKPMKDFEYLKSSVAPTMTQWLISMVIGLLLSLGLGIFFYKNDITDRSYR